MTNTELAVLIRSCKVLYTIITIIKVIYTKGLVLIGHNIVLNSGFHGASLLSQPCLLNLYYAYSSTFIVLKNM